MVQYCSADGRINATRMAREPPRYINNYIASQGSIGLRVTPSLTILRKVAFVTLFRPVFSERMPLQGVVT